MGDPKRPRRMYDTPSHPWDGDRIQAEKALVRKYGLKNKREVWKAQTRLRNFRGTARGLLSKLHTPSSQVKKESHELLARMNRMGLLSSDASLDDVLALDIENVLGRRLQTVVYLKGLASTPKQARQFITHGHVMVDGRKVTVPSYFVTVEEQDKIDFAPRSDVADPSHPVRARGEDFPASSASRPSAPEAPPAREGAEEKPAEAKTEEKSEAKAEGEAAKAEGGDAE